jgi:hypothetical protein
MRMRPEAELPRSAARFYVQTYSVNNGDVEMIF